MSGDTIAMVRELGSLGVVLLWSIGLWRWMHTDRKELTATLQAIRDAVLALRGAHANDAEERRMMRDTMASVTGNLSKLTGHVRQESAIHVFHNEDTKDIHAMVRELARESLQRNTQRRSIDDIEREHLERQRRLSEPPEE